MHYIIKLSSIHTCFLLLSGAHLPELRRRHRRGEGRPPVGRQVGERRRRLAPPRRPLAGGDGGRRQVPGPGGDAPLTAAAGGDGGADRDLEVHVAQGREHEDHQDELKIPRLRDDKKK